MDMIFSKEEKWDHFLCSADCIGTPKDFFRGVPRAQHLKILQWRPAPESLHAILIGSPGLVDG